MPSVWIKLHIRKRYPPSAENVIYTVRAADFEAEHKPFEEEDPDIVVSMCVMRLETKLSALNYGHEEFYLVCQLAFSFFFFFPLFHCCTESNGKAMKNLMAHLPSNLGDSWLRQIILSHFQLDQCLSFGPISVVWSTSPENHCWEVNSDFALWNQPFNRS